MTEFEHTRQDIEMAIADYEHVTNTLKENLNAMDVRMLRGILYHRKMNLGLCYYFTERHKIKSMPYLLDRIIDVYIHARGQKVWLSEWPHTATTVAEMMWRLELRLITLRQIIENHYNGDLLQEKQHVD